jgi:tRNA-modifying protein YgfZ
MDNYYVNLNHRELLVISGIDSERFLQGQLSCDLSSLSELDSCPGCICDNKGRVVASFTLWKITDVFYLEMEAGVAEIAEQHLKKYSVFYKSDINIENEAFMRFGLIGSDAESYLAKYFPIMPSSFNQVMEGDGSYLRLADPINQRYELWQNSSSNFSIQSASDFNLPEGQIEDWKLLDQTLGLYRLQSKDSALYTPQELNYDQLGYISFTKGCYTGQEIVARMHYRGKAKKRLYLLQISADSSPEKNMLISTTENKTVGEIIDVAVLAKNKYQVLAIANESVDQALKVESLSNSELKLILF